MNTNGSLGQVNGVLSREDGRRSGTSPACEGSVLEVEAAERVVRNGAAEAWSARTFRRTIATAATSLGTPGTTSPGSSGVFLGLALGRLLGSAQRGGFSRCLLSRCLLYREASLLGLDGLLVQAIAFCCFFLKRSLSRCRGLSLRPELGLVLVPEEHTDADAADDQERDQADDPTGDLLLLGLEPLSLELDPGEPFGLFGLSPRLGFFDDPKPFELSIADLSLFIFSSSAFFREPALLLFTLEALLLLSAPTLFIFSASPLVLLPLFAIVFFGLKSLILELHQVFQRKLDGVFLGVLCHLYDLDLRDTPLAAHVLTLG